VKKTIAGLGVAALVAAAVAGWARPWAAHASPAATSNFKLLPPAAPAGQMVLYGHIKKLTKSGSRYVLRFDPAWFTSGLTASVAKKEDTGSSDVPNDNYVIEEGRRLLSYIVTAKSKITVLTDRGTKGITATPISAEELYRIVNGGRHRKLFEPLESGVWIRVRIDTVQSIDQQYRP
jgi:hypothetical protein